MVNEKNFIQKLKENDKDALQYIIDNFTPLIFTICKNILGEYGSLEDVEECVSDIFIFVWENNHKYSQEKSSFKTWLSVISKYKSLDFRRKLIKRSNFESNIENNNFISSNDIDNELLAKELNGKIMLLINNLKTIDKQLFIKRYFFNESIEDMAKEFNLTRQAEDLLVINVDTGYSENKSNSIFNVELKANFNKLLSNPDYNSWNNDYSKDSNGNVMGSLKSWCIKLNHPNSPKLNLYIESFYIIKKGPWIIPIDKNKITNNK